MKNKYKTIETQDDYFECRMILMNLIAENPDEKNALLNDEIRQLKELMDEWEYRHDFKEMLHFERMRREVMHQLDLEEIEAFDMEEMLRFEEEVMKEVEKMHSNGRMKKDKGE